MRIANPVAAVREQKCRRHLHVEAVELDHDYLAIAAHVGVRVRLRERILHFLKKRRLAVPEVNLEAAMNVARPLTPNPLNSPPLLPFPDRPSNRPSIRPYFVLAPY